MKKIVLILIISLFSSCKNDNYPIVQNISDRDQNIYNLIMMSSYYEKEKLKEEDFVVEYNNMVITDSTTLENITDVLGYPIGYEDSNYGNISNNNGYRRWQLKYPDYSNENLTILLLSKQEINEQGEEYHGDTYIIGIYLKNVETYRGLNLGDDITKIFELYGEPDLIQRFLANPNYIEIIYQKDCNKISIILDESISKVKTIFIDYKMNESVKDQKIN